MAQAAYNLSIILAKDRIKEAIEWSQEAYKLRPDPRYGYTFAFYLQQDGKSDRAVKVLREVISHDPAYRGSLSC